jgi:hypothetical protein
MHQDYLPTVSADYFDVPLTLKPTQSISFPTEKKQKVFKTDGNSKEVTTLSKNNCVYISVGFENLNSTNKDILLDLYLDLYKANGLQKSFLLNHPTDGSQYVCRFMDNISETMQRNFRHSYSRMSLLAIGADRNLISTQTWIVGGSSVGYIPITTKEEVLFGGDTTTFSGDSVVW